MKNKNMRPMTRTLSFTSKIASYICLGALILSATPLISNPIKIDLSTEEKRAETVAALRQEYESRKQEADEVANQNGWFVLNVDSNDNICELVELDEDTGAPRYDITDNANAAITTAATPMRNMAPYSLSGAGETVGIWDGGVMLTTHQEFGDRVTIREAGVFTIRDHPTHVGGVVGAAGVDAAAQGMAPNVRIDSYALNVDIAEMTERAAAMPGEIDKISLSNHSYGRAIGWQRESIWLWFGDWPSREDDLFGKYSTLASVWDELCYQAPYFLPFKSAGNDRSVGPPAGTDFFYWENGERKQKTYDPNTDPFYDNFDNGGYDTMSPRGCAKNIMTVGAVADAVDTDGTRSLANASMASFSSWGPTDDGRIKPDIVANGISLYSPNSDNNSHYVSRSGTSFSSPNAMGSAVLITEYYKRIFNEPLVRSSTLKGLILHTTDDLGNVGPDYQFGWGLMNTETSVKHIDEHPIIEAVLSTEDSVHTYDFAWDGSEPIRATVCWTDPEGFLVDGLDNPTPMLINDLDIRIVDNSTGEIFYPYKLNPENPAEPATTGDNSIDNVEQIFMSEPDNSRVYTLTVSHKGSLYNDEQYYSLIISNVFGPIFLYLDNTPEDHLTLSNYQATNLIEAFFTIEDGRDVNFTVTSASGRIVLGDGFHAEEGSNFTAQIQN